MTLCKEINMKRQPRTPEILRKSHAHKSDKDYSRKNSKSDWFDTDTDKDKLNMTFKKIWDTNYHSDYYDSDAGWIYLGSDNKHDYYVNHKHEHTSIVYGLEPREYISAMYDVYITRDNIWTRNPANPKDIYPYTQLRKLLMEHKQCE